MPTEPSSSPDAGGVALLLSAVTTVVGGAWLTAREVIAWRNRRAIQQAQATADQNRAQLSIQAEHEKQVWQRIRDLEKREGDLTARITGLEDRIEAQLDEFLTLEKAYHLLEMDRDRLLVELTTTKAVVLDLQTHHAKQISELESCVKRVMELETLAAKWSPFPPEPQT